jgi:hypothetical protein
MQDSPASTLAISDTGNGTTFNPCFTSMSSVRGAPCPDEYHAVYPDRVGGRALLLGHDENTIAVQQPGMPQLPGGQHGFLVNQGTVRLQMQRPARNPHQPDLKTQRFEQTAQRNGTGLIGPGGQPDEYASGRHQDVAAVGKALAELQHHGETFRQRRGQRLGFRDPAGRSGPQQHRGLREGQRRVLHEDRIRKRFQRLECDHVQAGRPQRGHICLMLGHDAFVQRCRPRAGAQAVDHAPARSAHHGRIEVEHPH